MKFLIPALLLLLAINVYSQSLYQNIKISDVNSPNELSIALNPHNPNHIVLGANIDNYYFSFDAGKTWNTRKQESKYGVWGDPCIVFDAKENLYYFHLSLTSGYNYDRIVCQKSINGGINWNALDTFVGNNPPHVQDKEWATVDLTEGPYKNNVYVFWTQCGQGETANEEFDNNGSRIPDIPRQTDIFSAILSDDGNVWSKPQIINKVPGTPCNDVEGTVLVVNTCIGPEGEVYAAWSSAKGVIFDRSTDGGATWLANDITIDSLPVGFKYSISGIYRCFSFPTISCDRSGGKNNGRLYASWSDKRAGINDADVWYSYSDDKGSSWKPAVKVNSDPPETDQFFSAMNIDQSNGHLYLVYYNRSNNSNGLTDVYLASSTDGGETFKNEVISESPFLPNESTFFGDYISIDASFGTVRPVWTRLDDYSLSIWTALINE